MLQWLGKLFDTTGFVPRWECGDWSPVHGWTHILSDLGTWGAYMAIPCVLVYFVLTRKDIPFSRLFWLFGAFILACGTVHLLEAIIFWQPVYRLSAIVKATTCIVSWATVIALVRIVPEALNLPGIARLNEQLKTEIEQRQRSEEMHRSNEQRLRLALEAGHMGTWDWDLESGQTLFDQRELEICGLDAEQSVNQVDVFFRLVHPEDAPGLRAHLDEVFRTGIPYLREFRIIRPDGQLRWLAARGSLIRNDHGKAARLVGINYDITAQKDIEQSVAKALLAADAANQAKSEFLANMSHEIRTPMTAILGCADMLLPRLQDEEHRELLAIIRNQGRALLDLLNDILDLSKIEAGKLHTEVQPTQLVRIVAEVASLSRPQATEKGLDFQVEYKTPIPETISTDPLRMRQILLNLISNAIKYTDAGEIAIVVECDADQPNGKLKLSVRDSGVGIPLDEQRAIFDAFTQARSGGQRRQGGAGLGLTICQRLVDLLGGELEMQTKVNVGSTFTISFPLRDEERNCLKPADELLGHDTGDSPTEEPCPRLTCRVLIAEDTRGIQFLLRRILEDLGADVTVVPDGQQAVEAALAARSAEVPFDLVLMDMQMPVLNGFDAVARLRESGFRTPIIALTAAAMRGDRERCLKAGCDEYLSKPIDRRELIQAMIRHCQNQANA